MTVVHRYLGAVIIVLLLVIVLWGLILRVAGRTEVPTGLWAVQHWTENLLIVQVVLGIVLLLFGRRVPPGPLLWLHYWYGSLFPLIAIVGGRLASLRRETRAYVGLGWGALFALVLILRAVQTACGDLPAQMLRCFSP